ncbi:MAG TPA: DMT family transporter [Polyangia bacterium]|nr:DMT family transporter [Polyangia bacterium]
MLLGLAASASWALANVVVQRAGRAVGALQALFWAQLVGIGVAGLGATLFGERPPPLTAGDGVWIAVAGLSGLLGYVCLFYAFEHGRLTLAVPIMSSWAVLSSALSLVIFHERLTASQLLGSATVIAGAVVVGRHAQSAERAGSGGIVSKRWLPAAVGAAIGFGVLIPAMRRLSPVFGPAGTIGVVYAADLALALPLALAFRIGLAFPRRGAWLPIALAGFLETAGSVCITLGVRRAPVAIVSPFASLAAAFTVLCAWAIQGERPARGVLIGAALVSAGVVVLAL